MKYYEDLYPACSRNANDVDLMKARFLGKRNEGGKRTARRRNVVKDQKLVRLADVILIQKITFRGIFASTLRIQSFLQLRNARMTENRRKRNLQVLCRKLSHRLRLVKAVYPNAFRLSRRIRHGEVGKIVAHSFPQHIGDLACEEPLKKGIIFQLQRIYELAGKFIAETKQMCGKADLPSHSPRNTGARPFFPFAIRTHVTAHFLILPKAVLAEYRVFIRVGQGLIADRAFSDKQKSFKKFIHIAS